MSAVPVIPPSHILRARVSSAIVPCVLEIHKRDLDQVDVPEPENQPENQTWRKSHERN